MDPTTVKLTDEELDLLATAYVKNYALAVPPPQRPVEVSPIAEELVDAGLLKEDYTLARDHLGEYKKINLVRPTVKGIAVLKEMDPVRVLESLVRVDATGAGTGVAVFWILRRLSLEQLPLVLSHETESVRKAAKTRMSGFEKDEANRSE